MKEIEIYWTDLTEEAQKRIRETLDMDENENGNWDLIPMTTLMFEDEEM